MKLCIENLATLLLIIVAILIAGCEGCKRETTTQNTKQQASNVLDTTAKTLLDEKPTEESSEVVKPLQPLHPEGIEVIHTDLPVSDVVEHPYPEPVRAPGEIVPSVVDYLVLRAPQLPDEIKSRLADLRREMMYSGIPDFLNSDVYAQRQLEILTGGMSDEAAVAFLEKYKYYNAAILERISADVVLHTLRGSVRLLSVSVLLRGVLSPRIRTTLTHTCIFWVKKKGR